MTRVRWRRPELFLRLCKGFDSIVSWLHKSRRSSHRNRIPLTAKFYMFLFCGTFPYKIVKQRQQYVTLIRWGTGPKTSGLGIFEESFSKRWRSIVDGYPQNAAFWLLPSDPLLRCFQHLPAPWAAHRNASPCCWDASLGRTQRPSCDQSAVDGGRIREDLGLDRTVGFMVFD